MAHDSGALGGLVQLLFAGVDTYARAGRFEDAYETLERASAVIERTGEQSGYQAQVPMFQAQLMLQTGTGTASEAASLLIESIVLNERSEARWLALRSAIRLGRIAAEAGVRDLARAHLSTLHEGFTEGHESPQLIEARALLADLTT
jgi:hypothetical protein